MQLLAALVESGSTEGLVCGAAQVLTELVAKRMEPLPKISLIQVWGLSSVFFLLYCSDCICMGEEGGGGCGK